MLKVPLCPLWLIVAHYPRESVIRQDAKDAGSIVPPNAQQYAGFTAIQVNGERIKRPISLLLQ
jgi:hypothetical protein